MIRGQLLVATLLALATAAPAQSQELPPIPTPVATPCLACDTPVAARRTAAGAVSAPLALCMDPVDEWCVSESLFAAPPAEAVPRRLVGALFGAIWGGLAGLALGYAVGTQVERSCDGPCVPGLGGAIVGGAIGIVVGATVGALVVDE